MIVSVAVVAVVPLGVTLAGLNEQVAFVGSPLQARFVAALNPLNGVTITVTISELPALTVAVFGVSDMEKSATGAAVMTTLSAAEVDVALVLSPPYTAVME
jgi:hypothetical protein